MRKKISSIFSVVCILLMHVLHAQTKSSNSVTQEYFIPSDDVVLYCKTYGTGTPLFLLHGAMVTMNDWDNQIKALSAKYKLICIDNRGHGRSTFTDKPITYHLMSDDIINVMDYLKIDSAHVVGFGDGGNMAVQLAIEHPERIMKLALINANLNPGPDAVFPYFIDKVREWNIKKMTELVKERFVGNPNPELLQAFVLRMQHMLLTEPNYNVTDMSKISLPTLVIASDYGLVKVKHALGIFENLQNAYLCIIPGARHYCIKEQPKLVNETLINFLLNPYEKVERY